MSIKGSSQKGSFFWSILIQFSTQIISFVVTVILARILEPRDFGVIGLLTVLITLSKSLLDGGLAASLIRTKDVTNEDYSTVFYINLASSIILYALVFILAPQIAVYFEVSSITNLLRVYGLVLIISSLTIIQSVRLNKNLQFKTQFKLILPSLIISGTISIVMAYFGFGVWSLVWKEIIFIFLASVQLWFYSKWIPSKSFSKVKFKYHFSFGYKLLLTDILSKAFKESYKIVIGKVFSIYQLGLFTRSQSMAELPNTILFNAINRVMFPLLSKFSDDDKKLKDTYRYIIRIVVFIVIPFLCLLGLIAKPLFIILLTKKWLPAVPYFQFLLLVGSISPLQLYLLNLCKVKGRSDLVLKLSFIEYVFISMGLVSIYWFGLNGLLYGMIISAIAKVIVTMFSAGKLINYTTKEQILDIYQPFVLGMISLLLTTLLLNYTKSVSSNFLIIIIAGFIFYIIFLVMAYCAKNKVLFMILNLIKNKLNAK